MVSISNLPSKNREAGLPWRKGYVCFLFYLTRFLFFHLYIAGSSDLAQFSCPTGHIIEWYWEWAGLFHHKWHNHILKVRNQRSWKYGEKRITSRWHLASLPQSGTILWLFSFCFLLSMLKFMNLNLLAVLQARDAAHNFQRVWRSSDNFYIAISISSPFPCFYDHIKLVARDYNFVLNLTHIHCYFPYYLKILWFLFKYTHIIIIIILTFCISLRQ